MSEEFERLVWREGLKKKTVDELLDLFAQDSRLQRTHLFDEDLPLLREEIKRRVKPETEEGMIYDREEIIENCTVQILTNSVTGEQSVGWWKNED
jgi:hypothetical protein